jgi:alkanesulfonate monooxygenase SsuD/methylene tetrahydromethanopterin reductase-like flavin-dependent oxidoreductase (luciferase family)
MREEFEAIGTPPYEERGAVGDEYIAIFKELWTSDNPTFNGRFSSFSDVTFLPKPVQKPHPPIWVGGESPPALRRAGRLGNGWHPIGENPRFPVETPEHLSAYLSRVHGHARDAGRDPSEIAVAYSALWYTEKAQTLPNGQRRAFTGSAEQLVEDVRAWEAVGVQRLMINFFMGMDSVKATLDRMEQFATGVKDASRA